MTMMYYSPNTKVFFDGYWVKASEAKTSMFDQTLHYGTGVLDGIRSYKNSGGFSIFKAKEHFIRLKNSAEKMKLKFDYSVDELVRLSYELIELNKLDNAYIRPLVTAGPNMRLTPSETTHFFMAAWKWAFHEPKPLNVMISSYLKPSSRAVPIDAKVVGNYAAAVMVSTEAKMLGYDEAILLDQKGHVTEGPGSNIFYEKDNVLYTPKRGAILPGITRATVFKLAKDSGVKIVEKDFLPEELYTADYAFFCGTASEISQIASINGEELKGRHWDESASYNIHFTYQQKVLYDETEGLTIV